MSPEPGNNDPHEELIDINGQEEEPPPVLKSWKNIYILVLGNLLFWVSLFSLFTWMFK
jgi:hypothetical protein